ncbi:metal-dependent hydrolase [Halegenticoccus tardaugens]|uniref:metal-dependent hydrolase n=1 Tax=Halegenticoccus tardaugens TaxID=2071624 RepID=UPI00100B420C|nr:metal-dependent hydrolase [Halegenticoccus tardaugens]
MPSILVHVALAGLVGAGLLGEDFTPRAAAAVMLVAAVPDLDAFVAIVAPGAHRVVLHTLFVPVVAGGALAYDLRAGRRSIVRGRWGDRGVRVAWVALAALLLAGILPDLFTNGVNALYPAYDRFYVVDGTIELSSERGVVQTVVETDSAGRRYTTENLRYHTGFNPAHSPTSRPAERVFPVADSGTELLLLLVSAFVVGARLLESGRR